MKTSMHSLPELARLLQQHNQITREIAALIGRPAERGHIGEFIATHIFDIALATQANNTGNDGVFRSNGMLNGRTVNIKFYAVNEYILDMSVLTPPDYYLVLTGPIQPTSSSRGALRSYSIEHIYLFAHEHLVQHIRSAKIGVATSVRKALWQAAEIYPQSHNQALVLTETQRELIGLFHS